MTRRQKELDQEMARKFFVINLIIQWQTILFIVVCAIKIETNIHDILNTYLMPSDLFLVCIKCKHDNKVVIGLNAVHHIMDYHR